ncbi:MAG: hypothetical protein ACFFDO_02725 [Candidatus Thorarchaeota archaeon]
MSLTIYKVVFKGNNETIEKHLTLIFKSVISADPIKIPSGFILELKKLSETNKNVVIFKNIDEVIKFGQESSLVSFNYYYILLFQLKNEMTGFLIGNVKRIGDILLGTWPFNKQQNQLSTEKIRESFNKVINNTYEYRKICLIN